jgi:hypothetical protein
VRSPATLLAATLGVLIGTAVVDLAPTARAGYQPVTVTTTVGLDIGADAEPADTPQPRLRPGPAPDPTAWSDAAGAVPPRPAPGGHGSAPPAGLTPPAAVPAPDLIVYVRSAADRFDLPDHPTSVLDPPRPR